MKAREFIASTLLLLTACGVQAQPAGEGPTMSGDEVAGGPTPDAAAGSDPAACRRPEGASTEPPAGPFGSGPHGGRHPAGRPSCFGALSPEERRALRRDIRQAGQELYLPRPPRHHGGPPPFRRD